MVGFVFVDAIDRLITTQFSVTERQDVTVTFVEPRSADARHALARLPGVITVEPQRSSPARVRAGHRERYLAITRRRRRRPRFAASSTRRPRGPAAAVGRCAVADARGRPRRQRGRQHFARSARGRSPAAHRARDGIVDDVMGLSVYMEMDALHRMMREGDVSSGRGAAGRHGARAAAVHSAESDARSRRRRFQARGAAQLPRNDGRQHGPDASSSTCCSRASSRSAWSTTPRACRSRSAATSWPACACLASRARRFRYPDGRARAADAGGAAGRRAVRYGCRRRSPRTVQSEVYRFPLTCRGGGGVVVSRHHRRGARLGPDGAAASRSSRSGCGAESTRVGRS